MLGNTFHTLIAGLGLLIIVPDASAAEALHYNQRGGVGLYRVEAAQTIPAQGLVVSGGTTYATTSDFFAPGDVNTRQVQDLSLIYAPGFGLEIFFIQRLQTNRNMKFWPKTTQSLGDPRVGLKYGIALLENLAAGGMVNVLIPTSAGGAGLNPKGFRLAASAHGTYSLKDTLSLSVNLGYVLDNTASVFKRELLPVQRFAAQISKSNMIVAGVGASSDFLITSGFGLSPFAEFTAGFSKGSSSPMIATVGLKAFAGPEGLIEFSVGSDIRVGGAPVSTDALPGLPPWEAFARLTMRLQMRESKQRAIGPISCTTDAVCDAGQSCLDGACVLVREVPGKEIIKPIATYAVKGVVTDAETGDPVLGATVQVVGAASSALAVDPKTGVFRTHALPAGEGLLQLKVQALGYGSTEKTVPKGKDGTVSQVSFKLKPEGKDVFGELKGSLKDGRSGKPVRGQIFVAALNKRIRVGKDGNFKGSLRAGRHQILVSARGYETQRKEIIIRAGDVVILNLDMNRQR